MEKFVIFDSELLWLWLERRIDSSFKIFSNFLFSVFNLIQERKNQKKLKIENGHFSILVLKLKIENDQNFHFQFSISN